jgi:hypothetical protein
MCRARKICCAGRVGIHWTQTRCLCPRAESSGGGRRPGATARARRRKTGAWRWQRSRIGSCAGRGGSGARPRRHRACRDPLRRASRRRRRRSGCGPRRGQAGGGRRAQAGVGCRPRWGLGDRGENGRPVEYRPWSRDRREHRDLRDWRRCTGWVELERFRGCSWSRGGQALPPIEGDLPAQDLRWRSRGEHARFASRAVAVWRQLGAASQALGHGGMKGWMKGGRKKRAARLSALDRPPRCDPRGARHLVTDTSLRTPRYVPRYVVDVAKLVRCSSSRAPDPAVGQLCWHRTGNPVTLPSRALRKRSSA